MSNENNKKKTKNALSIVFLCIAIAAAAALIILAAPLIRNVLVKKDNTPVTEVQAETAEDTAAQTETQPLSSIPIADTSAQLYTKEPDSNKNYVFYIDKTSFDVSENADGVTVLTAKTNPENKMTVTPLQVDYEAERQRLESEFGGSANIVSLKIAEDNIGYKMTSGSSSSDTVRVIYCIDDRAGGCVEVDYTVLIKNVDLAEKLELMLSMFRIEN